jgi:biotin carboxyl carrier protein
VVDGRRVDLDAVVLDGDRLLVRLPHRDLAVTDVLLAADDTAAVAGAGVLVAPMHGTVTAVEVVVGDEVTAGQRIVSLEAMKMEHVLEADVDGTVEEVAAVGTQVATDTVLARIRPSDEITDDASEATDRVE